MITDKQIEKNRSKIPKLFIQLAKGCWTKSDSRACTLGIIAQGLDVVSTGQGANWSDTRKVLSASLGIPEKELKKVERIHDGLSDKNYNRLWTKKKIHRKAYQYLILKHGLPF